MAWILPIISLSAFIFLPFIIKKFFPGYYSGGWEDLGGFIEDVKKGMLLAIWMNIVFLISIFLSGNFPEYSKILAYILLIPMVSGFIYAQRTQNKLYKKLYYLIGLSSFMMIIGIWIITLL